MKLHLSEKNKMLGGVCGGIAETIGIDPSFVRIGFFAAGLLLQMIAVIAYIAMWIFLPKQV